MPRYHFHVCDEVDVVGTVLPDLTAARVEAVRVSGDRLEGGTARICAGEDWTMRVTDDVDLTLFTLDFVATDSPSTRTG